MTIESEQFTPTPNTEVRVAARGSYDRAAAYRILDDGFVAHVGFASDDQPFVIPMVYGRDGDRLLLHGSVATRIMRSLDAGAPVCVTVTHIDALVLAKSHFHHSVNYRSVVVLGTARRLRDDDARHAFAVIVDHAAPGRAAETRPTSDLEYRQTMVLEVPINEASVKVRDAPPIDDPDDLASSQWAATWSGVLTLSVVAGAPEPDDNTPAGTEVPGSIRPWRRP